jgi:hypothetical protein
MEGIEKSLLHLPRSSRCSLISFSNEVFITQLKEVLICNSQVSLGKKYFSWNLIVSKNWNIESTQPDHRLGKNMRCVVADLPLKKRYKSWGRNWLKWKCQNITNSGPLRRSPVSLDCVRGSRQLGTI